MDLILKHFESSDATIINSHACTSIKINGEEVRIAIVEKSIRKSHIMSELEKLELKMGRGYSIPTWDYTPSGFLSLVLEGNIYDAKYFTESHKKSIESLLSIFIDRIILKAEEIKKERIEREEKQKLWELEQEKRREQERLKQREEEKINIFFELVDRRDLAQKAFEFIEHVEQIALNKNLTKEQKHRLESWLLWAKATTNHIDPTNQLLKSILES